MANNFCNLRHDVLNYAPQSSHNNTGQIACRLCNRVFLSTQALITHIESHMEHEEGAIRRLYSPQHINSQRTMVSPHLPPSFPFPTETPNTTYGMIFQEPQPRRHPIFNASQVDSSQPLRQLQSFSSPGNNVGGIAQLSIPQVCQWKLPEGSPNDCTKAYIMQLEIPIKKIDFIDLVNTDDDNNSEVQTLDLTLKL